MNKRKICYTCPNINARISQFFKKKAQAMSRYILILLLLTVNACSTTDSNVLKTPSVTPSSLQSTTKTSTSLSSPAKKTSSTQTVATVSYDPKVANHISQNQAAMVLKTAAPEFAHKILAPHCTVEKFVSGLNSTQTEIIKISASTIEIKTTGAKIGNGNIRITAQGKNAEISSAVIGKFKRTDTNILRKFAQNICDTVDEKLK